MWEPRERSVRHVSIIRKSGQATLLTSDRSCAVSPELKGQGEEGRVSATLSGRDFKSVAADKFHLLIGGAYAGVAVGVTRLRRGIFELCF
jgi:hypothetical protein